MVSPAPTNFPSPLTGNEMIRAFSQTPNGMACGQDFMLSTAQIANLAATEGAPTVETVVSNTTGTTLAAAALVGGQINRSGPTAAFTDTTDTAVAIVGALPSFQVNAQFYIVFKNATIYSQTLAAGAGVTLPGTVLIPGLSQSTYFATVGGTSGSPTVTFTHVMTTPIHTPAYISSPQSTALTTVGAGTITAAGIFGGITVRSGSTAAFTDTTDTAANIITLLDGGSSILGQSQIYYYQNNSAGPATITGGMGVTVSGITIVPPGYTAKYLVTYTATATVTMVGISLANASNISPVPAGATVTLTAANVGSTTLLNTAAGSVATLPPAVGSGNVYKFVVTTTATSNKHAILAASVSDFLNGVAVGHVSAGTTLTFSAAAATAHSIQMPVAGTQPSGGIIGDWYEFTDAAANLWTVKGMYQSGTTSTTPFSAATT